MPEPGRCSYCGYEDRPVETDEYGWRQGRACCDLCRAQPREAHMTGPLGAALSGVARVIIAELRGYGDPMWQDLPGVPRKAGPR